MASDEQYKQISDELAEILRELLATGDWNASLFLRTASSKLQALYDETLALSKQLSANSGPDAAKLHQEKLSLGFVVVFVSIYQSDPHSLMRWENTLKTIREYSITRPIYRTEEHVAEAIRSKPGANEAYVSVYIKGEDIITPYAGKKIEDRWGHELLTLRDGSLLTSNIVEFVHQDKRYEYKNGKLLLKSDSR